MITVHISPTAVSSPPSNVNQRRKSGVSATAILINFVCGMIGPGCFSVALSLKQSGLWAGLCLVFLMGTLSSYSMHKIVLCSQHLCDLWVVNGCLIAFQLGVLSISFVFAADHCSEVLNYFIGKGHSISKTTIMLLYFWPQLCLNFMKNIRVITFLSFCGNAIIFVSVGLVAKELIYHDKFEHSALPAMTDIEGFTMAAGGLIYAFEGQAMVLTLENRLKRASDMVGVTGVLCTSMNLVMLLYAFLGFFGYLAYGPAVADSLTLNLPNSGLTVAVKLLLVAKVFLGSALQLYVIMAVLAPILSQRYSWNTNRNAFNREYGPRLILTVFSLVVAVCVPSLYDIIPLVGITAGMLLSLILPAVFHTLLFLPQLSRRKDIRFTFLTCGLYASVNSIITKNLSNKRH